MEAYERRAGEIASRWNELPLQYQAEVTTKQELVQTTLAEMKSALEAAKSKARDVTLEDIASALTSWEATKEQIEEFSKFRVKYLTEVAFQLNEWKEFEEREKEKFKNGDNKQRYKIGRLEQGLQAQEF